MRPRRLRCAPRRHSGTREPVHRIPVRLLPITLSEIAPRISAGAFILNSGLGKRGADAEAAAGIHGFAAGTYPFLKSIPPQQFVQGLATAEIAVGALLLTPFVPTFVAGAT